MISGITVGFALCGSFCTFSRAIQQIRDLADNGANVIPVMSECAYGTDTRFGSAKSFVNEIEEITHQKVLHTQTEVEPIGPKKLLDILVIAPCTGNTVAKLANGITDTSVTLAAKAHLRNNRPLLVAVSTNDGLSNASANIGRLLNNKNIYLVPMGQDNSTEKPRSLVADFTKTQSAIENALNGVQLQPIYSYFN